MAPISLFSTSYTLGTGAGGILAMQASAYLKEGIIHRISRFRFNLYFLCASLGC